MKIGKCSANLGFFFFENHKKLIFYFNLFKLKSKKDTEVLKSFHLSHPLMFAHSSRHWKYSVSARIQWVLLGASCIADLQSVQTLSSAKLPIQDECLVYNITILETPKQLKPQMLKTLAPSCMSQPLLKQLLCHATGTSSQNFSVMKGNCLPHCFSLSTFTLISSYLGPQILDSINLNLHPNSVPDMTVTLAVSPSFLDIGSLETVTWLTCGESVLYPSNNLHPVSHTMSHSTTSYTIALNNNTNFHLNALLLFTINS